MNIATFTSKRFLVPGFLLLILIFLATFPLYGEDYYILLVGTIFMFAIVAVSWAIFSGPTGYISLAPAAFFGLGMYISAILFARGEQLVPLPVAVVAGGLICFILALLVGLVTLRLRGVYFVIFTLGLAILVREIIQLWEFNIGSRGRYVAWASHETFYYLVLGILVATLLAAYFIKRSRYGLALQSIGGNEEGAAHMGVNTTMVKVMTFAISAFFMGAAGATWAPKLLYVDPVLAFSLHYSFLPVLMAILGGTGQLYGPIIGAAIFIYLEENLRHQYPYQYMLIFGIIMLIVVLFLPGGLVELIPKLRKVGPIARLLNRRKGEQHANT